MSQGPPSVADLKKKASDPVVVDHNLPINIYYKTTKNLAQQAKVYHKERNFEAAFVLAWRQVTMFCEQVPKHPQYKGAEFAALKKEAQEATMRTLEILEEVKPVIEKRHAEYVAKVEAGERQRAAQAKRQKEEEEEARRRRAEAEVEEQQRAMRAKQNGDEVTAIHRGGFNPSSSSSPLVPPPENYYADGNGNGNGPEGFAFPTSAALPPASLLYPGVRKDGNPALNYAPLVPPKPGYLADDGWSPHEAPVPLVPSKPSHLMEPEDDDLAPRVPPKPSFLSPENEGEFRDLTIPTDLPSKFLVMAKPNTLRNCETCGILAGTLQNNTLRVTHLLIPKQTSTADTCTTTNEEELFDYQDKNELITLGWIHTHPTQRCFMSSVDLHTHCSYQLMLPEAVAIVCAPSSSPNLGIFRLTNPPGLPFITNCRERGFHPHRLSDDELYVDGLGHSSLKMMDVEFKIKDFRSS